jgi:membrane protein implicated in regulation of membrane protease activity
MGLVYLFSLVVGLGILVMQVAMGAKGDGGGDHAASGQLGGGSHGGAITEGEAGHAGDADGHDEMGHDHGADGSRDLDKHLGDSEVGALSLFFSTRFWIFASLAFGMSGSLIHVFALAGTLATLAVALSTGVGSGLFAVLTFRAVKRSSATTSAHASEAVGQIGRVLVACGRERQGQVRVELRGHSVDLLATTDDEKIARGELILVEDVRDSIAHVSRRPPELE